MKKLIAIGGLLLMSLSSIAQTKAIKTFAGLYSNNSKSIEVIWETCYKTPMRVLYSTDGKNWLTLSNNAKSPFKIEKIKKFNQIKLETVDKQASSVLRFEIKKNGSYIISDLFGNKMSYGE